MQEETSVQEKRESVIHMAYSNHLPMEESARNRLHACTDPRELAIFESDITALINHEPYSIVTEPTSGTIYHRRILPEGRVTTLNCDLAWSGCQYEITIQKCGGEDFLAEIIFLTKDDLFSTISFGGFRDGVPTMVIKKRRLGPPTREEMDRNPVSFHPTEVTYQQDQQTGLFVPTRIKQDLFLLKGVSEAKLDISITNRVATYYADEPQCQGVAFTENAFFPIETTTRYNAALYLSHWIFAKGPVYRLQIGTGKIRRGKRRSTYNDVIISLANPTPLPEGFNPIPFRDIQHPTMEEAQQIDTEVEQIKRLFFDCM